MSNYNELKSSINRVIKSNNNREITGQLLQNTLNSMVNSLGANYHFAGFATPTMNPGSPDQNVFYVTSKAGTYVNFGNIQLPQGFSFLMWKNNQWSSNTVITTDNYWEEYTDPRTGRVSVKLKSQYAGVWAEGFISSLGISDIGSSLLLGEFLTALNEAGLAAHPDAAGKTVVWNGTAWVFGTAGGGTDMNDVWTALAGNTTEQINGTHLSNALNAYATKTWVEDQGYLTNESYRGTVTGVATGTGLTGGTITSSGTISINSTYQTYIAHGQTAYGWGNHANAGYLTSSDIQDMATKTWVTNTANAASATKLQTARMLWGNNFNGTQSIGTPESWASLNWVTNIVMKGNLDWRYGGADSMTSRILEHESGGLSLNACAYHFSSNKFANSSTFPGGALNVTTDWGSYSFRNVFMGNSLFENTLFLRQGLYMKNGFPIFMKNNAGANVSALVMESDNLVLGSGAYTNAGISTYIRGNTVNFQTANGANAATQVGHFDNGGNFCIDVAGKSLYMNDGTTTRNMVGINIPATHFHVCYGAIGANWQTRIYGGGGDNKGIHFYHGTTLAASVQGSDHSLIAYYNINLTTNNKGLYTRNTNGALIDTVRMGSNNILNFGYGCSTQNHETRIYGGATAGIGFYCGNTEVARVHKDAARQGIRIGDGLLSWDSTNNAFKVSKINSSGNEVAANLYATGGVSALGMSAGVGSLDYFTIDNLTSKNLEVTNSMTVGSYDEEEDSGSDFTITTKGGALYLCTDSNSNWVKTEDICSADGANYWKISMDGSALFANKVESKRFYFDSNHYLEVNGASLCYFNGTTTKIIAQ